MSITVTILETGTIRIRPSHRCQRASRPVPLRRLRVLAERRWTAPLPINTYLVDHPEGPILWDCGESPHAVERGFFPLWQPFFHLSIDIRIGPDEGIGARLAQHGLKPADLKAVVLSHLHHDHGDGIPDLTGAPIYVTREHWKAFSKTIPATLEGAVPQHWPEGFTPRLLEPTGPAVGPWQHSYPITSDSRVLAVDTPATSPSSSTPTRPPTSWPATSPTARASSTPNSATASTTTPARPPTPSARSRPTPGNSPSSSCPPTTPTPPAGSPPARSIPRASSTSPPDTP